MRRVLDVLLDMQEKAAAWSTPVNFVLGDREFRRLHAEVGALATQPAAREHLPRSMRIAGPNGYFTVTHESALAEAAAEHEAALRS